VSQENSISRLFGCSGLFGNGGLFIILIIGIILLIGDELIEWIMCEENILIWIVLLVLLLTSFDL
jgi:hypothetical protein